MTPALNRRDFLATSATAAAVAATAGTSRAAFARNALSPTAVASSDK